MKREKPTDPAVPDSSRGDEGDGRGARRVSNDGDYDDLVRTFTCARSLQDAPLADDVVVRTVTFSRPEDPELKHLLAVTGAYLRGTLTREQAVAAIREQEQ